MAVNYNLQEFTCQRSVEGKAFSNGLQYFNFCMGAPNCWNPSKSYFKIDMEIQAQGTNTQLVPRAGDMIAFADNCAGNLYTNCFVKFGGQDISQITSFVAQASALKKRLNRSQAWLQSIGKAANFDLASYAERLYQSSTSVPKDNGDGKTQLIFKGVAAAFYGTATVAISETVLTPTIPNYVTVVTGTNTSFATPSAPDNTQVYVGDIIVINGTKYVVTGNINTANGALVPIADDQFTVSEVAPSNGALHTSIAATSDFYFIRQNVGSTSVSKNIISVLWQPPLGIFDVNTWLGSGDYKISLNPDANYALNAVETNNNLYNTTNGWKVNIQNVRFYCYSAKASIPEGPQTLHLVEMNVQSKPISSATGTNNLQFSVPASTLFITVFVQSSLAGSAAANPPSMFKAYSSTGLVNGDLNLSQIQVTYAGINKPATQWDSKWSTSAITNISQVSAQTNQMIQRYYDSYLEMNNGANSDTGVETIDEWLQRGPFFCYSFVRDASDRSTEVQINITYNGNADSAPHNGVQNNGLTNCFIASFYNVTCNYTVTNGLITALATRQV